VIVLFEGGLDGKLYTYYLMNVFWFPAIQSTSPVSVRNPTSSYGLVGTLYFAGIRLGSPKLVAILNRARYLLHAVVAKCDYVKGHRMVEGVLAEVHTR
jgi:hypothetical protein